MSIVSSENDSLRKEVSAYKDENRWLREERDDLYRCIIALIDSNGGVLHYGDRAYAMSKARKLTIKIDPDNRRTILGTEDGN